MQDDGFGPSAQPRPFKYQNAQAAWLIPLLRSALLTALLAACAPTPAPPPDLVLITVDTLRADELGCYGGPVATPAIDRLAAAGVAFDNAACPMPMTRPSLASLHSGLYPRQHGVVHNALALPEEAATLAEALAAGGYRTAGFVGVNLLAPNSGLAQGFGTYSPPRGRRESPAAEVVAEALAWLDEFAPPAAGEPAADARRPPYFLWLHLFDPHMPYEPPRPTGDRRTAARRSAARRNAGPPPADLTVASWGSLAQLAAAQEGELSADQLTATRQLYRDEIAAVDRALAPLLDRLLADPNTAVVLTADHGECFEHGYFFRHSNCLYDGAARVPLIVRLPGGATAAAASRSGAAAWSAGGRQARPVELLDLAPTLLALADLPPLPAAAGRSLLSPSPESVAGSEPAPPRAYLQRPLYPSFMARRLERLWGRVPRVAGQPVQLDADGGPLHALRGDRYKYLVGENGELLFDLSADPGEETNLLAAAGSASAAERRLVIELRRQLARRLEEHPLTLLDEGELDPELIEMLEALGYL